MMGSRQLTLLAVLVAVFGIASAQQRKLTGLGGSFSGADSFDERMKLYTSWAKASGNRERRLLHEGPEPAPTPTPPTHPPSNPPSNPPSSPTPPSNPPSSPTPPSNPPSSPKPPSNPPSSPKPPSNPPSSPTPPAKGPTPGKAPGPIPIVEQPGGFNCSWKQQEYVDKRILAWNTGYVNLTVPRTKFFPNTKDFLECRDLCLKDAQCQGWTRVAAGDAANNFKCYLLNDLKTLDPSPARFLYNVVGPNRDPVKFPQIRYVDEKFPILFESGTKDGFFPTNGVFPQEYYGCPYKFGRGRD